jgi:hypothetical protein
MFPVNIETDKGPVTLRALLDSGAELNLISQRVVDTWGLAPYELKERRKAYALGDHKLTLYAPHLITMTAKDRFDNPRTCHDLFWGASFEGFDLLLGYPWLRTANPIPLWGRGEFAWGSEEQESSNARVVVVSAEDFVRHLSKGETAYVMQPTSHLKPHDATSPHLGGDSPEPRNEPVRAAFTVGDKPSGDRDPESYSPLEKWQRWQQRRKYEDMQRAVDHFKKTCEPYPELHWLPDAYGPALIASVAADAEPQLPKQYASYADVFADPWALEAPTDTQAFHAIDIEEGKDPPVMPIYPLAQSELKALREYLDKALERGWIRESKSPAGAPILFVPKKDGSLRLCVDYRGLNKVTIKNRHPLPLIGELLDRLSQAKIFTKLDLRDAYHRIRIKEGDEWKTAFRTRYGHYEYLVMPFGLANAPATFQNYIHKALGALVDDICVVYLDDILIYSENEEQHAEHVRRVLERLRQWGLYAKLSKCEFHTRYVEFLGFVVTSSGVVMDPERVRAIREWPTPTCFRDIQVFLGFANFYRRFIHNFSGIARPLNELLQGSGANESRQQKKQRKKEGSPTKPWEWTAEVAASFHQLRDAFLHAPVLRHFDPSLPITVITDASDAAYAGILLQPREQPKDDSQKHWQPVAYHSRGFHDAAIRYDTHDKELMAIFECFVHWRHYLEGSTTPVRVLSDHNNLRYFMTTKVLNSRQARWAERLAAFDFVIEHKPGVSNPADGLSRRPDYFAGFKDGAKREQLQTLLPTLQNKLRFLSEASVATPDGDVLPSTTGTGAEISPLSPRPRRAGQLSGSGVAPYPALNTGDGHRVDTSPQHSQPPDIRATTTPCPALSPGDGYRGGISPQHLYPRLLVCRITKDEEAWKEGQPKPLQEFLQVVQRNDSWVQDLLQQSATGDPNLTQQGYAVDSEGLLRRWGRVVVPNCEPLRQELLRIYHDDPMGGHSGPSRTIALLKRKYYWPGMGAYVKKYVDECDGCQRNKPKRHKPYGLLAPLPVPTRPWADYSMDFIVKLPPSPDANGKQCDAILVIVDRFSKFVMYFPCSEEMDAQQLAELWYNQIVCVYGTPSSIVSDRGALFTSTYWSTFWYLLKVQRKLSTSFHPQTDGQTERQNQEIEAYLRMYVNWEQSDWATRLVEAAMAHNCRPHASTKMAPRELALGSPPTLPDGVREEPPPGVGSDPNRDAARQWIEGRAKAIKETTSLLELAQTLQAKYYNRQHVDKHFKVGDSVLLSSRNLKTKRPHKKLDAKYLGPFEVLEKIGQQAYKLKLPPGMSRLHDTFNVALLEPYRSRPGYEPGPVPEVEVDMEGEPTDDGRQWGIEAILAFNHRNQKYRVKWTGGSNDHTGWLSEDELAHAPALLQQFWDEQLPSRRVLRPTAESSAQPSATPEPAKRGRGRPRGSKNRKA